MFDLYVHENKSYQATKCLKAFLISKDGFRKLQTRYKGYQQVYTDCLKEDLNVGQTPIAICNVSTMVNQFSLLI